jgi:hypothetical protein
VAQTGTFCSAYCTVGVPGCGFDGSEEIIDAACLLPQVPGEGQGDRGLCFELCDETADCLQPGAVCVPEPQSGRAGVCLTRPPPVVPEQPEPEDPEPLPDAGAPPGETCEDVDGGQCVEAPPAGACESDADCGAGVCNPTSLVCIAAPPVSVGAACAVTADCRGAFCAPFDDSAFCSLPCSLGTPIGCEPFGSDAFCLVPVAGRPGLCLCTELCDAPSDCTQAGYVCELLTEPLPNGRTGTCLPPLPADE